MQGWEKKKKDVRDEDWKEKNEDADDHSDDNKVIEREGGKRENNEHDDELKDKVQK